MYKRQSLSTSEGTILHSYVDGDLVSVSDVSVEFDFSNSSSDSELILFGINANDSRDSIEVDAKESQTIVVNFSQHGVYEVAVYAIDADDNYREESVTVKLNYRIDWSEYETNNPKVETEWKREDRMEKERQNGIVAKALDGQRYPLPLCECMWV